MAQAEHSSRPFLQPPSLTASSSSPCFAYHLPISDDLGQLASSSWSTSTAEVNSNTTANPTSTTADSTVHPIAASITPTVLDPAQQRTSPEPPQKSYSYPSLSFSLSPPLSPRSRTSSASTINSNSTPPKLPAAALDPSLAPNPAQKKSTDPRHHLHNPYFPLFKDDAVDLDPVSSLQAQDPIGIRLWKLFADTKTHIPNGHRYQNITWRLMFLNLQKLHRTASREFPLQSSASTANNSAYQAASQPRQISTYPTRAHHQSFPHCSPSIDLMSIDDFLTPNPASSPAPSPMHHPDFLTTASATRAVPNPSVSSTPAFPAQQSSFLSPSFTSLHSTLASTLPPRSPLVAAPALPSDSHFLKLPVPPHLGIVPSLTYPPSPSHASPISARHGRSISADHRLSPPDQSSSSNSHALSGLYTRAYRLPADPSTGGEVPSRLTHPSRHIVTASSALPSPQSFAAKDEPPLPNLMDTLSFGINDTSMLHSANPYRHRFQFQPPPLAAHTTANTPTTNSLYYTPDHNALMQSTSISSHAFDSSLPRSRDRPPTRLGLQADTDLLSPMSRSNPPELLQSRSISQSFNHIDDMSLYTPSALDFGSLNLSHPSTENMSHSRTLASDYLVTGSLTQIVNQGKSCFLFSDDDKMQGNESFANSNLPLMPSLGDSFVHWDNTAPSAAGMHPSPKDLASTSLPDSLNDSVAPPTQLLPDPTKQQSASKDSSPTCSNCFTQTTPLWRRNPEGQPLCNACGLFLKLHGVVRPLSLKTDYIKKRNRAQGGTSCAPAGRGKKPRRINVSTSQSSANMLAALPKQKEEDEKPAASTTTPSPARKTGLRSPLSLTRGAGAKKSVVPSPITRRFRNLVKSEPEEPESSTARLKPAAERPDTIEDAAEEEDVYNYDLGLSMFPGALGQGVSPDAGGPQEWEWLTMSL